MSIEFEVSEDIKELVDKIIKKNNLQEISDVKYQSGSEIGDGYMARTISVSIIGKDDQVLKIFLKCARNVKSSELFPIEKLYSKEIYFYESVYPEYIKFLKELNAENVFHNIPKCYGTSIEHNIIALENIREKGFTLFNRKERMNDQHITLVLKTFARYHAVSYAFKNQRRAIYDELVSKNLMDFWARMSGIQMLAESIDNKVDKLKTILDPVKEKHILDKCDNMGEMLMASMSNAKKFNNEYSIITQGDCWCNNIMFLYDNEDKDSPDDIMLIDWQVIRQASPVFDIAYFFYPVASEEALGKLDYYLAMYHEELSKYIKLLGSNPEILYPLRIFKEEWKKHCKFGFAMSFLIMRAMLSSKNEVPNIEDIDFDNLEQVKLTRSQPIILEDEYMKRIRILADHFVRNDFL